MRKNFILLLIAFLCALPIITYPAFSDDLCIDKQSEKDRQIIADFEKDYGVSFDNDFDGFVEKLIALSTKEGCCDLCKDPYSRVIFSLIRSYQKKIEWQDEHELFAFLHLFQINCIGGIGSTYFKDHVVDFLLSKLDFLFDYYKNNDGDNSQLRYLPLFHCNIIEYGNQEQKKKAFDHYIDNSLYKFAEQWVEEEINAAVSNHIEDHNYQNMSNPVLELLKSKPDCLDGIICLDDETIEAIKNIDDVNMKNKICNIWRRHTWDLRPLSAIKFVKMIPECTSNQPYQNEDAVLAILDRQIIADFEKDYEVSFDNDFDGFVEKLIALSTKESCYDLCKKPYSRVIFSLIRSYPKKIEGQDDEKLLAFLNLFQINCIGRIGSTYFKDHVVDFLLSKLDFLFDYYRNNNGGNSLPSDLLRVHCNIIEYGNQEQKKKAFDHYIDNSLYKFTEQHIRDEINTAVSKRIEDHNYKNMFNVALELLERPDCLDSICLNNETIEAIKNIDDVSMKNKICNIWRRYTWDLRPLPAIEFVKMIPECISNQPYQNEDALLAILDRQIIADFEKDYEVSFDNDFDGFVEKLITLSTKDGCCNFYKDSYSRMIFSLIRSYSRKIEEKDEHELFAFLRLFIPFSSYGLRLGDLGSTYLREVVVDFLLSKLDFLVDYYRNNNDNDSQLKYLPLFHRDIIKYGNQDQKKKAFDHYIDNSLYKFAAQRVKEDIKAAVSNYIEDHNYQKDL